jgi:hypothetical protein
MALSLIDFIGANGLRGPVGGGGPGHSWAQMALSNHRSINSYFGYVGLGVYVEASGQA